MSGAECHRGDATLSLYCASVLADDDAPKVYSGSASVGNVSCRCKGRIMCRKGRYIEPICSKFTHIHAFLWVYVCRRIHLSVYTVQKCMSYTHV